MPYGRIVQKKQGYPATSLSFDSNVTAGNLVLVVVSGDSTCASTTITSFTAGTAREYGGGNSFGRAFHYVNHPGGAVTVSPSNTPTDCGIDMFEIEWTGSANPVDSEIFTDHSATTTPTIASTNPSADVLRFLCFVDETQAQTSIRPQAAQQFMAFTGNHVDAQLFRLRKGGVAATDGFILGTSSNTWIMLGFDLILPSGHNAVIPGNVSQLGAVATASGNSITWNHQCESGEKLYVVISDDCDMAAGVRGGGADPTGITFNGDALTKISGTEFLADLPASNVDCQRTSIWVLDTPDTGASYAIVVTWSAASTQRKWGAAISLYNAGDVDVAGGTDIDSGGTGTTISQSLTATQEADFCVGIYSSRRGGLGGAADFPEGEAAATTGSSSCNPFLLCEPQMQSGSQTIGYTTVGAIDQGATLSLVFIKSASVGGGGGGSALLLRLQTEGLFVGSNH